MGSSASFFLRVAFCRCCSVQYVLENITFPRIWEQEQKQGRSFAKSLPALFGFFNGELSVAVYQFCANSSQRGRKW